MRRRAILLVTTMAVALVVACSVALAADITCPNRPTGECVGTNNADTMTGTTQADDMRGRGGEDTMYGRGGADDLDGGEGIDEISAGNGHDAVEGGPNPNAATPEKLDGGDGDDSYFFGEDWGDDKITDGESSGEDTLVFSSRVERLNVNLASSDGRGEVYSDGGTLFFPATVEIEDVEGGNNRDVVRGNGAPNTFILKKGNDSLYGRAGNDVLVGGVGADAFNGGPGNDSLEGGDVSDVINGDLYIFEDGWGNDNITDAAGTDHLFFGELTSSVTVNLATGSATDGTNTVTWTPQGIENVIEDATGGIVNDSLTGNDSGNTLSGQGGDDTISGGDGDDVIYGRGGSERTTSDVPGVFDPGISGGPGKDTVYGDNPPDFPAETGDDVIDVAGGASDPGDTVDCGDGDDTVLVDAKLNDLTLEDPEDTIRLDIVEDNCEHVEERPID